MIASGGQGFALDPPGASRPWTVFTMRETPKVAKQQIGVWGRRPQWSAEAEPLPAGGRPVPDRRILKRSEYWFFFFRKRTTLLSSRVLKCGREDSNFHRVSPTSTSSLRVYHSATAAR